MPAAIDTTDGVANFASFREPAWHRLGTVFTDEVTDYRVMLDRAGLTGWDVRLVEIEGIGRYTVPTFENVRTNPVDGGIDRLGVVGNRFENIQNEDAFATLQSLADGARWETAGAINSGATVFGSIAFDREIVLDPEGVADRINTFLLVSTWHDGTGCLVCGATGVRVVCANTLNMAMGGIKSAFKIRHTVKAAERMAKASEMWRNTHSYFDALDVEARELFAQPVNDVQFNKMVLALYKPPAKDATKAAVTKHEKRVEVNTQQWKRSENAGIRGTAWGALNALTEAAQWYRNVRKDDLGVERAAAAGAGFTPADNVFRENALAVVKSFA